MGNVLWGLAIIIFIVVIFWIVQVFRRNFEKKQQLTIPIIRMMITYFQLYSIISSLEMFSGSSQANFFLQLINVRAVLMTPAEAIFDL